ncbi:hypothetical protein, partial [Porphyromonas uenonis]
TISVTPSQLCTFFRKRTHYDDSDITPLRKSSISSGGISDYPRRYEKILRNFEIFLPKFHFILPNFYFPAPWRIVVSSLEIPDFLGRREIWRIVVRG